MEVSTVGLAVLLTLAIVAYSVLVYALPAAGIGFDVPLLTKLGKGIGGLIVGVLVMVVGIVMSLTVFILGVAIFGYGLGLGLSMSPFGKTTITRN